MALERYREKRNFKATPEPRGGPLRKKKQGLSFVIQKHAASHLHYDFRLELNGVLLSWAVPKGPSFDPADKRLAMQVEDHPLEYGGFEGIIPAKQYGGGTVLLWDRGTWIPQGDAATAYEKGRLKFELVGEKLRGGWTLIRTHGSKYGNGNKKAWLLIKETDEFARRGVDARIVDAEPDSVASGRSLDEIANDREHVWNSNRSVQANVAAGAVEAKPKTRKQPTSPSIAVSAAEGARKSELPAMLTPKLAMLVDSIPEGDGWLHELKYDGYRMVCRIERGKVRVYSRNGKEWTNALPQIAAAIARLKVKSAWIDGEVAVVLPDGRTSFQKLQNALSEAPRADLAYFVFDVPFLDGYDLRAVPLLERKRLLRQIVPDADATLRFGVEVQGSGDQVFAQLCKLGFEGAVSKRIDSTYQEGVRNREWVKVKCGKRQEMVIGGFTDPQGSRNGFGALLLGVYEADGTLRYSGKVGTGFDDRLLTSLRKQLDKLEQKTPPFANPPRGYEARGAHWVKPTLVGEVSFTEWTHDGTLRHPSFEGLRADKVATDVVREYPADADADTTMPKTKVAKAVTRKPAAAKTGAGVEVPAAKETPSPPRRAAPSSASAGTPSKQQAVAGVVLSHPDKMLFPEAGLTKRDLADYYAKVSEWMVPHLRGRPLSLVRCPDGWKAQCFYHKHADKGVNSAVTRVQVPEGGGTSTYMSADSVTAVVGLLQWGVAEMHPWGSRVPRLDRPDRLIFDFDPDDGVAWSDLVSAVQVLRTLLDNIGLRGFLKTTGGKGLHVVLPIRATLDWPEAKAFTKSVADLLVSTFPDRFIATLSKAQRKGKIFVDYLRNAEGATAIAPYSARARSNAPVAMPIAWEELDSDVRFDHFNVKNALARLTRMKKDPWADFFDVRQSITQAAIRKLG